MSNEFEIIVDFSPVEAADGEWRRWLKEHDISGLDAQQKGSEPLLSHLIITKVY